MKLLLGLLLLAGVAHADYSGVIYEMGSNHQKKLFNIKVEVKQAGDLENTSAIITGVDGKVALTESTSVKGIDLVSFQIDQKQLETTGHIEVGADKVHFSKTKDGKEKTDTEKKKDTFVINGNFQKYLASKWPDLMSGKTVEFRFGVWDRMETVGFEIKKVGEEGSGDKKRVILKMKPSSMIIAAIVNPIEFKFGAEDKRLYELKGRVGPKQNVDGKWKDLDAEVVYTY